jgi:hypothetical protein
LPTPSKRPFQPGFGIHTSTLINESVVGVSTADTSQNGGTFS